MGYSSKYLIKLNNLKDVDEVTIGDCIVSRSFDWNNPYRVSSKTHYTILVRCKSFWWKLTDVHKQDAVDIFIMLELIKA